MTARDVDARFVVPLGSVKTARTRQFHGRSAVDSAADTAFVGTAHAEVRAVSMADGADRWRVDSDDDRQATTLVANRDRLVVGERGEDGLVRSLDAATGDVLWTYETAELVGRADRGDLFSLPEVVDVAVDGDRTYVVARRHGRAGPGGWERAWEGAVVVVESGPAVVWAHEVPASATACSLDAEAGLLAVAYDRRPDDGPGVGIHDADTGEVVRTWDVEDRGDRRVGDVALDDPFALVACQADQRGHLVPLGDDREDRWAVDLATKREVGEELLYAYPTHATWVDDRAMFVTGSTFPVEERDCEELHPFEHTVFSVGPSIDVWTHEVGGHVGGLDVADDAVAATAGQNFRAPDPETHAAHLFDAESGHQGAVAVDGVPTAVAVTDDSVLAVEEPVEYHERGAEFGEYRLHCWSRRSIRAA